MRHVLLIIWSIVCNCLSYFCKPCHIKALASGIFATVCWGLLFLTYTITCIHCHLTTSTELHHCKDCMMVKSILTVKTANQNVQSQKLYMHSRVTNKICVLHVAWLLITLWNYSLLLTVNNLVEKQIDITLLDFLVIY